jgi:hypothetical protein
MDAALRGAERAMRIARELGDVAALEGARRAYRLLCQRGGGPDPRVHPRVGDAVRVDRIVRLVDRVDGQPHRLDLVRVSRTELAQLLVGRGLVEVPNPHGVSGTFFRAPGQQRGVHLYPEWDQHYSSGVERALELLHDQQGADVTALAAELGVRGPWVEWRLAIDFDAMGRATVAPRRRGHDRWADVRKPYGARGEGRCTLRAWRAWARPGEVVRLAEEVA